MGRSKSISKKLTVMNMLVSGMALLVACSAFFAYDQFTFRQSLIRTISVQAQIIGSSTASALIFNDAQSASNTLAALKNSANITSAGIFYRDGKPFAQYVRQGSREAADFPKLQPGETEVYRFTESHLLLVHSVDFQGKELGVVFITAGLQELNERLKRYAAISLLVLLASLVAALFISSVFKRSVAQPIGDLAKLATAVSRDKNYSVRAIPSSDSNEISVLIFSFNEMLTQIQERDDALQGARNDLESKVVERTNDLIQLNRELEAFSYSVSHDLRGPLESINGFSYLLGRSYGSQLDLAGRELIQGIRGSSKRMSQLIDDLLSLSQVAASAVERREFDLSEHARKIMEDLCRSDPGREVDFVAAPGTLVFGDPRLLHIVLDNLLRNAWKYTSHNCRARIEFGPQLQDGKTVYYVKDDGSGFDPKLANRLFKPFQRLHSSSEFSGTGIGLATVRRIVERHGGEVWAESALGKGATFFFTVSSFPQSSESMDSTRFPSCGQ